MLRSDDETDIDHRTQSPAEKQPLGLFLTLQLIGFVMYIVFDYVDIILVGVNFSKKWSIS